MELAKTLADSMDVPESTVNSLLIALALMALILLPNVFHMSKRKAE